MLMKTKRAFGLATIGLAFAAAPTFATAEISASAAVASNYMWRGQELFAGGTVSGSVDYGHESGAYAGIWISSESGKHEYDMYAGFGGESGDAVEPGDPFELPDEDDPLNKLNDLFDD